MSASNKNDSTSNGSSVVVPNSSPGLIDRVRNLITEPVHFLLRLYFTVLLLIYAWSVKVFVRILQPLEPLLEQMHKIPPGEATSENIKSQFSHLLITILLFLSPLVNRVIGYATRPLIWARDKVAEYVEQGDKKTTKRTDPKRR